MEDSAKTSEKIPFERPVVIKCDHRQEICGNVRSFSRQLIEKDLVPIAFEMWCSLAIKQNRCNHKPADIFKLWIERKKTVDRNEFGLRESPLKVFDLFLLDMVAKQFL